MKKSLIPAALALVTVAVVLAVVLADSSSDEEASPEASGPSQTTASEVLDDDLSTSTSGWKTDFTKFTVSLSEFSSGGPGKDGIPAIDNPKFVPVADADSYLEAREPVVQLVGDGGDVRAYPLQILIWHEIVNDTVGGVPVTITFCPLCNTTIVFDRRLDGRVLDFGTTGNLRNSDLVMYDRQTETWWQQFGGAGVVGALAGEKLTKLPASIVAWQDFKREHPTGKVLSRDTGFGRSYGQNPYTGYDSIDSPPFFPATGLDDKRLQPKERVVFIERGDERVVVPFSALAEKKQIEIEVAGERLEVIWQAGTRSALDAGAIAAGRDVGTATVRSADTGKLVVFDLPFWFAVAAFAGDAEIVTG
ncbi:MAG: DUF3179 domain-containing protein [Actinobacteria bacterium]|nr:DUF3179 domain-containing protein [Actinomycetota bacterium]